MSNHTLTDELFNAKLIAVYEGTDPLLHPGLGIIASERDKMTTPKGNWDLSFAVGGLAHKATRSPDQTTTKTNDRIVLEPILNHFVKISVKNNVLISDLKKIAWNIHIDSNVRHVIGEGPKEHPTKISTDLNTPLHVILKSIASSETTSKALPDDVSRCDGFVYIFMNEDPLHPTPEPVSEGQFIKSAETTDDTIDFAFTLAQKGKRVKILLQYFNAKGHGASSEIIDTIVP